MLEQLQFYLTFPFVWYALIVGTLVALCSSLLGVTLVLKKYSFIGDSLSHVAFAAMAVAMVMQLTNNMMIVLPVTILTAVIVLTASEKSVLKGDSMLALISTGTLAVGYLIINAFSSSSNISGDVCATLFGSTSILTLQVPEVVLSVVLSVIVIILYVILYNRIFAVTFDEQFLMASKVNTKRYNLIVAVLIAVVITLGMKLVGSLLISALIIFPAITAMQLFTEFKKVVIASAVISVVCALGGIISSILMSTPVGSTIIAVNIVIFALCSAKMLFKKTVLA